MGGQCLRVDTAHTVFMPSWSLPFKMVRARLLTPLSSCSLRDAGLLLLSSAVEASTVTNVVVSSSLTWDLSGCGEGGCDPRLTRVRSMKTAGRLPAFRTPPVLLTKAADGSKEIVQSQNNANNLTSGSSLIHTFLQPGILLGELFCLFRGHSSGPLI